MKPPEHYKGREQTYLKHFVLERYLERVGYNIGSFADEFVFVDGFSGPWRATDQAYEDTSFVIAMNKLRAVRDALAERGRRLKIRCVFVEKNPASFAALQQVVSAIDDIDVQLIQGSFEDKITEITERVGSSFSLIFIDPTGWSGFALDKIRPLLQLRCEVLVNFMFDDINRHVDDARESVSTTFSQLFGGPGFTLDPTQDRERQIIEHYVRCLRAAGGFEHATYTRILKPEFERTYFYLVYGTRHSKGLREFRNVEKKLFLEQEKVRSEAKQARRIRRSGQAELFPAGQAEAPSVLERDREEALRAAEQDVRDRLQAESRALFDDLLLAAIEAPLVWESDVKELLAKLKKEGGIVFDGLGQRERVPKVGKGHYVSLVRQKH